MVTPMPARQPVGRGVLATDAYEITMAQLYFRAGLHERRVRFEHFYRSNPDYGEHQGVYDLSIRVEPDARVQPDDCER